MNRRQKIIVSVVGIFIVLLALVGITYGYFLTRIQGNTNTTSITVTTADLKLVYGDGNNIITGTNIEPGWTTNGQNGNPDAKTFTIKNEGNATVENFNIYLEDVINSLSRKEDLIYTITCTNTTEGATSTTCDDFEIVENEVNSDDELIFPSVMSIIAKDTLDPKTATANAEEHTYTITVTYKNLNIDQSEDMAKEFRAKVNIYDSKTKFLANEIITNVRKTGTFNYNKTTYINPSLQDGINYTIPAEQINGAEERIMSYTFDDYGTSYYYRGNVEDNYVNFSGMCWRIVRIEGDGSIKLILESQSLCLEGMTRNSIIGSTDWGYKQVNDNYLSDYKNSTIGMKNLLTTWLNETDDNTGERTNITIQAEELLKTEEWCLVFSSDATLKCNGETDSSKIGALTSAEVVFGGGGTSTNYNLYLNNDDYWYTLSDTGFYESPDVVIFGPSCNKIIVVDYAGVLVSFSVHSSHPIRPALTLKSNTTILEGGEGTIDKPYVIG